MSHFNFEESISVGIERANVAEVNKQEIAEIFEDFSESFKRASNNKIFSKIEKQTRTLRNKTSNPLFSSTVAMMHSLNEYSFESYKALILSNGAKSYAIAEIIENEDGYPLRIKVKDDTSAYSDKESLIEGLSHLVSRTEVGTFYKALMADD
ncbi:hypothetical protein [Acinetobacter sp. 10FS3-1]|uniref:hypothetical protein n=1 Tax=Acinetobacter sp. 10FS3-1 TaxID=2563897 RepID=UPI00157C9A54|nr:hypothetical protein [Acinetobacter sp. 10FS3-1]QKQ71938.1 hypothetical protein E5Y90_17240 [Acinetobacter sp. 10FS3-1]